MVRYLFLLMSHFAMAFPVCGGGCFWFSQWGHAIRVHRSFPARMRTTPSVTVYSLNGTSGAWSDASNIDRMATAQRTGHMGTNIEVSVPSGSDVRVGGHITVDAEL